MDCQQQQQQPTHYDAIILGTGLAESIVAASLARAGKQVLHIDRNAFYGEHGAAFDVRGLMRGVGLAGDEKEGGLGESYDAAEVWSGAGETTTTAEDDIAEIQAFLSANPTSTALLTTILPPPHTDITTYLTHPTASPRTLHALTTLTRLLTTSRQYTLDLSPKLLYARGPLVELLITSGVGKYLEFKALEQIWMGWEGAVEVVPGSKEDVFANKTVGLVEKRRLMKVLAGAAAWTEGEGREEYKTKPYIDYLRDQKLSPRLIAFVLNAIAFILETDQISSITTEDGLKATQRHLQSLGRWGKTAFLYTLYGAGSELAQAFCRMCAVYGGVYILDYPLSQIEIRESKDTPLSSEEKPTPRVRVHGADGTEFTADYLVASSSYLPHLLPQHTTPTRSTYRAISILDKSIHDASALNLTAVPPGTLGNGQGVCAVQGSWEVSACPRDKYVLHLTSTGSGAGKEDLKAVLEKLIERRADVETSTEVTEAAPDPEATTDADDSTAATDPSGTTGTAPQQQPCPQQPPKPESAPSHFTFLFRQTTPDVTSPVFLPPPSPSSTMSSPTTATHAVILPTIDASTLDMEGAVDVAKGVFAWIVGGEGEFLPGVDGGEGDE